MSGPDPIEAGGFGGFALAGMALALPMAALREVVPRGTLMALPCPAAGVVGCIDLRGTLLPVVDLRLVLGQPAPETPFPTVVVMVHDGHLVGLLADRVTGIFAAAPGSFKRGRTEDRAGAVFHGGVQRADDASLVSVLCPRAIAALHQVPMIADPEPARQHADAAGTIAEIAPDTAVPMMLMRTGDTPLAIEAMAVHATLSSPAVERSALALGHCRGVISYGGAMIPAVDLRALCWLGGPGPEAGTRPAQAFVMSLPAGRVAFLIDSVIDVVRTLPGDVMPVPKFALPHPQLFAGSLPASALPASLADRAEHAASQYLVLDAKALAASADVLGFSEANVPDEAPDPRARRRNHPGNLAAAPNTRTVVTFLLGQEQATPIDQLAEILPFRPEAHGLANGPMLGMMVDRGRSIPVLDLTTLAGLPPARLAADASVLVVESDGEWLGFAVPRLCTIDQAAWEVDVSRVPAASRAGRVELPRQLALVGPADTERLLPLLHLRDFAASIRQRGAAGLAAAA